ncbi:helix-turn-helix domain-containing protein [Streptomyces buecherae]|uniref:helix-turn-helix domain-containing protein n=1 Tax=Streptomyces buecherae TaxID=2763006 RepID=UPI00378BD6E9
MGVPSNFGAELRRLRLAAGMTLQELARVVNYSKGHLSKIERGSKRPTASLARQCAVLFGAEDQLFHAADSPAANPKGGGRLSMARRDAIATGVGSLLGMGLAGGGPSSHGEEVALPTIAVFRDQFQHMRRLGQSISPAVLLPALRAQTATVTGLATASTGSARTGLLVIAARFAEYTGWMSQEAGDEAAALRWTAEAVGLAQAGGDARLADYALVRQALVTMYNGAAQETIALAQQAQRSALPPRIRGLAAQREAQGHALAGDENACRRGLEQARGLLAKAETDDSETSVLGPTHLADPAAMVTGWCLYELGRPREAAEVLDTECRRIPSHALRTRTRYGLRRALAHAASGEIEQSCAVARDLLTYMEIVPSATVRTDVRRLDRELSRFRTQPAVRELQPALVRALHAS